ncbi:MAG: thiamine pyrophosphate-binding protein [Clostridia bacterium]|nr:thiamine pyrophosphate-binding protein [Clostridia bacterium]NCC42216.1 thiamine pyrophosphate-binding protein [Clostridia bacterium]
MKIKISDYIAGRMAESGISQVFTVTGGGAMHLNDSLGHHPELSCMYHHHEQAAAMAAEAYARVDNKMAAVCVTSGPGATNAITGALCAWMDSIPMLVLSGQVRYDTTVRSSGLNIRTMGVQEYDIVKSVEPMTKYAVMITDPKMVRYHLEKAIYLAAHGRPGPCWLDIPLNIQSAIVDTDELKAYDCGENAEEVPKKVSEEVISRILDKIKSAKRPVLFAGHGIRLAGAYDRFQKLVKLLGIPVVTGMSSVDLMESAHPLYVGRNGGTGDRAGNFAVQNSDVLLSIGSRQSFLQTGFAYEKWARAAYTILNDIDGEELKKESLHVSLPVVADAGELIDQLMIELIKQGCTTKNPWFSGTQDADNWVKKCITWKEKYPVVDKCQYLDAEPGRTNIYAFYEQLFKVLPEEAQIVVSVGTSRVAGSQTAIIKNGQRFYTNPVTASMGYGIPAAIGVCEASGRKEVICVTGEGSLQMNIQELQTIWHHQLPIHIFVVNNEGYHSIRQTQNSYFGGHLVGVGEESGDLSFPDLEKLAPAYGFAYSSITGSENLREDIEHALAQKTPSMCQVYVTKQQKTEPKLASRQLPDGTMVSASLEDMYPFLSREEMDENMDIPY